MILAAMVLAAAARAEQVALPDTRVEHLVSKRNGVAYRLHIAVPPDFESRTVSYPLLILLDADYSFPLAHSITTHLRERSDLPDLLVVGIGYDAPNYKLNRTRDYTPTNDPAGGYGAGFQKVSGGAPAFLDFIEGELFPWLARHHRAGPERVIVGHSYGGLFALWSALTRPHAFTAAIAVSPSLFHDDHLTARLESRLDSTTRRLREPAASGSARLARMDARREEGTEEDSSDLSPSPSSRRRVSRHADTTRRDSLRKAAMPGGRSKFWTVLQSAAP